MLAKELLTRTTLPIDIIAERCSFASVSHFYRSFRQYLGYTPGEFRKNHALITQED
jgi:transcriptional regulator GlxA family with amidase domain